MNEDDFIEAVMDRVVPYFDAQGFDLSSIRKDIRIYFLDTQSIYGVIGMHSYYPKEVLIRSPAHHEILLSNKISLFEIVDTLMHELCHVMQWEIYGSTKGGHGKEFSSIAKRVGLTGKMTEAHAGDELAGLINQWVDDIYPRSFIKKKLDNIAVISFDLLGWISLWIFSYYFFYFLGSSFVPWKILGF